MALELARNWWALLVRGLAAILLGVFAFARPGLTLEVLVLWFAAYALVDGLFSIVAGLLGRGGRGLPWWALLLEGGISVAAGMAAALYPTRAEIVLVFFVAGWSIITGILEIFAAIRLRSQVHGEWILVLAGFLSIAFGIALAVRPILGEFFIIYMIGGYALVFGCMLISLGFRLRSFARKHDESLASQPPPA